jgi:hypothetical protein
MVGGPCTYEDFPGTATIVSVRKMPRPQSGLPYAPMKVLFTFAPAPGQPGQAMEFAGRPQPLTLSGGLAPGPRFARKYGIRPGASFPCAMHLIRTGTCSPVVFSFQGLDVFDFFELTAK